MSNSSHNKTRVIFMGTPDFACPGFAALISDPAFEIVGVFTQPDRPVGRQQILTPPPIKKFALEHGLKVFQPEKIRTEADTIRELNPDLIVVIAYGQIIPPEILGIPSRGCINIHASLLPKYRGAACLNAPILNGDTETGVTIMMMEPGLDTGPILRQAENPLTGTETLPELHDRLADLGAEILPGTLKDFLAGKIEPQAQDDSRSSYVRTLKKEDGCIDWQKPAIEIERMIRAYNPWPGTHACTSDARMIKIISVRHEAVPELSGAGKALQAGELFRYEDGLAIRCGQDSLVILRLQIAGGKALEAKPFLAGHSSLLGTILS